MMKLRELLNGLDILETNAELDSDIREVRYDSRLVESGDLFIAVTGAETDGHKYIPMAREKGAACVLCERAPEDGAPFVRVADSRRALAVVGGNRFDHPAREMTMIGITGTSGKTTSTYLIKSILEQKAGAKVGLIGTIQNMIGDRGAAHRAHHAGVLRAAEAAAGDGRRGLHPCGDGGVLPRTDAGPGVRHTLRGGHLTPT